MKYLAIVSLILVGCGDILPVKPDEGSPVVKPTPTPKDGLNGEKGVDAEPCIVSEGETTISFICPTSTVTVNKPQDGLKGADGIDGVDAEPCVVTETHFDTIITCPTSSTIIPKAPYIQTDNISVYKVSTTSIPHTQFTCIVQQSMRIRTGSSSNFVFEKYGSFNDTLILEPSTEYFVKTTSGGTFKLNDLDANKVYTKACSF
jgi:hypothetical protein